MNSERALWELVIEDLRAAGHMAAASSMDRQRVRWAMRELYLLGERPTPDDVARVGGIDGAPTRWSRAVATLWAERRREPTRVVRGRRMAAFALPRSVADRYGLEPIERRLAREVARAAAWFADAVGSAEPDDVVRARERELRQLVDALCVSGGVR